MSGQTPPYLMRQTYSRPKRLTWWRGYICRHRPHLHSCWLRNCGMRFDSYYQGRATWLVEQGAPSDASS